MLDAIAKIERYTQNGREEFLESEQIQDAVIRNFEILGEAAKQLSEEVRAASPNIPWRKIAGMRDMLIHGYAGVNLNVVWDAIEIELPTTKAELKLLAERFPPPEE